MTLIHKFSGIVLIIVREEVVSCVLLRALLLVSTYFLRWVDRRVLAELTHGSAVQVVICWVLL